MLWSVIQGGGLESSRHAEEMAVVRTLYMILRIDDGKDMRKWSGMMWPKCGVSDVAEKGGQDNIPWAMFFCQGRDAAQRPTFAH